MKMSYRFLIVSLLCSANVFQRSSASSVSDQDIRDIAAKLWAMDPNKAGPNDIVLDYQANINGGFHDDSPNPFFKYVNPGLYGKDQVFQSYLKLVDNNFFNPDVEQPEKTSPEKEAAISDFLHKVTNTTVFRTMYNFLSDKGVIDQSISKFESFLRNFWFGLYSRAHGPLGSSGFEHVFIGEWKGEKVDGQHFWAIYHTLEKKKKINYYGYYKHDAELLPTIGYKWEQYEKYKGGFFIGTSPEFEFSLYTLCVLTREGNEKCRFAIENYEIGVTAWKEYYGGKGPFLGTSYPVAV